MLGGGEKYVQRHRDRGRLLARERVELLVDRDTAFLELSPLAGWGTDDPLGAGLVTGIGQVERGRVRHQRQRPDRQGRHLVAHHDRQVAAGAGDRAAQPPAR